jgi:type IV secretion system protein VirB1
MIMSLPMFAQLAAACAPSVHVDTLAAIARTESRFHVHAINDNTTRHAYRPANRTEAIAIASALRDRGHSLDLGLMQINSVNLGRLGMSVAEVFEPCRNIAAGAQVLSAFYRRQPPQADSQATLKRALSEYNTGSPTRGLANGYVGRVLASAEIVVPAIRTGNSAKPEERAGQGGAQPLPPPPATWDVWANARAVRERQPDNRGEGQGSAVLLQVIRGEGGGR